VGQWTGKGQAVLQSSKWSLSHYAAGLLLWTGAFRTDWSFNPKRPKGHFQASIGGWPGYSRVSIIVMPSE
jgi:hypothetical protein